jgi:hydroxysqualene synthase
MNPRDACQCSGPIKAGPACPSADLSESAPVSIDHYENFPVASVLCPPRIRPAVLAIYHFARTADDLADEGLAAPAQRLADLSAYRQDLDAVCHGRTPSARWAAVFVPLARCIQNFKLPPPLLAALLDAFEQDVHNPAYADRAALLDYCRRSANPVGRLLMHLYGINDVPSLRQSDAICSALQLINFWQDLSVDGPRGRLYVPHSELQIHGVTAATVRLCEDSPGSRQLVHSLCNWAVELMHAGADLALRVPGRAGWELRLVVQGGLKILEKIARSEHAALQTRPTLSALDAPQLLWRAARMQNTAT